MTNSQESRRSMLIGVNDFLKSAGEITRSLPDFDSNYSEYQKTLADIDRISEMQNFDKRGFAIEKAQLREILTMIVRENSIKLTSYANLTNNGLLKTEAKFTASKLSQASDTILKDYAQIVYDKAQENLSNLSSYGITQETQSVLQNSINSYAVAIARPRLGQREKSEATKELAERFRKADILLGKLDSAINITISSNPQFHGAYFGVRKVVETGTGSLILKGAATEINGNPLKGAKFTFVQEGGMKLGGNGQNQEIVKKTAEKGNFYVKNMPEGIYKVTVTKTGYKDKVVTVNVAPGEMASLNVEMERV